MKTYAVTIPIAGFAYIEIEAGSKGEAKEKAFNDITKEHIEEWDCYEHICSKNVLHNRVNPIPSNHINIHVDEVIKERIRE